MERTVCRPALLLGVFALLLVGCAGSNSVPRPRVTSRTVPPSVRRTPPSPQNLGDLVFEIWTEFGEMAKALAEKLYPEQKSAQRRLPLKKVLSILGKFRLAMQNYRKSLGQVRQPTRAEGRALVRAFKAYLDAMDARLRKVLAGLKLLYNPILTHEQKKWRLMNLISAIGPKKKRGNMELKQVLCRFLKSQGVREDDARWKPCPRGRRWLTRMRDIKRIVCACVTAACARAQEQTLYILYRNSNLAVISPAIAEKVTKTFLQTITCIAKNYHPNKPPKVIPRRP